MFLSFFTAWVILALAICQSEGGTLSETLKALGTKQRKDVIIELDPVLGQVLQNPALSSLTGDSRKNQIINLLKERSQASQQPILNALNSLGLRGKTRSFWVANRIVVRDVDSAALNTLTAIPGSFIIRDAYKAKIYPIDVGEEVKFESNVRNPRQVGKTQWGVEKINAPQVWGKNYKGKGVVVGIIDTGVNINHEALKSNYKNDKYSWLDAFGEHVDEPYDGNGHGTHCTGTIAGTGGCGVAPEANWMACRGLDDEGSGNETTLLACGEFMACPSGNSSRTCSGFPNVISNSWGGLIGNQDWFNPVVSTWRSLNIIPIFALGNSGPACSTSGSPGDQENLISVGSTDPNDQVSSFSSRGPALLSSRTKPEVSAPGKDVVSAMHDKNDGYRKLSGTSMACPHVAGATALLLSADPSLDFDKIKEALEVSAVKPKLGFTDAIKVCTFPAKYPNNGYGNGRVDVLAALESLKKPK